MQPTTKPTFSGHETFQCRHLWLKKGYDFVKSGKAFSDEDAVVELGVGKNMVTAIRYWMLQQIEEDFIKKNTKSNPKSPYLSYVLVNEAGVRYAVCFI